ncbi:MAG: DUF2975 domain-containing protein [Cyclobacteriaceae bacterium]
MNNSISLKVLYILTKVGYWGLIGLIGIVTFAGFFMIALDPQLMKLGFPSDLFLATEVIFLESNPGVPVEVELSASSIDIPVKFLDTPTICYVLFMTLLWLSCLTMIFRYFKLFMKQVVNGHVFEEASIFLVKKAALGLVILEVIELISAIIGYYYIQRKFELGNLEHDFSWPFLSSNLLLALTLWVLAHIFQKGRALEEEQKLTV